MCVGVYVGFVYIGVCLEGSVFRVVCLGVCVDVYVGFVCRGVCSSCVCRGCV